MEFLQELHEARLTRNEHNVRVLTYTDCCERLYLSLLILAVMNKFPVARNFVKNYATKTSGYDSYKHFRMHSTDLYNFIYFVTGDEVALAKLKDPGAAKKMQEKTTLPVMAVNRYIMRLKAGTSVVGESDLFIKLEFALGIKNADYKNIRRIVTSFDRADTKQKREAITKLLYAARAKLRSSDIIDDFSKLAAIKDLESERIRDNEPTISTPDIPLKGKDLALYQYLVGSKNLMLTKNFIENAKSGRSTNGAMNRAYLPVIELVDDIVKAGPAYIQLLRTLQKRAKKAQ